MKTAEEWAEIWPDTDFDSELMMLIRIKQIQLDAMKEGLRRANRIVETTSGISRIVVSKQILTAAKQLTEKDL
jgi:hypothetical protein